MSHFVVFYTANIRQHMAQMASILRHQTLVHILHIRVVGTVLTRPFFQIAHNNLQVRDGVIASFDVVVAQILRLCTHINGSHDLLRAEFVHRVASLFLYPLCKHRLLIFHRLRAFD